MTSGRDLELNEVGWWSRWVKVRWFGANSYVMLSSDFDEFFFNRAGFVDCEGASSAISRIEKEFQAAGRQPCFCVLDGCRDVAEALESRGYAAYDRMSVLQLDKPAFKKVASLEILSGLEVSSPGWASVYSYAFYGDARAQDKVSRIVERLKKDPSVTLFEGKMDGVSVGILAGFRTPELFGAYCIGTVDKYRRMGIAGSLIQEAIRVASTEQRLFILQTILSESVEDFYLTRGFRRLYMKQFLGPQTRTLDRQRREGV